MRPRSSSNPCRCGRQIEAGLAAGILDRDNLVLAVHPRDRVRLRVEAVAQQLDAVVAIGDLYRIDRFTAPSQLWDQLRQKYPDLLEAR